MRRRSGSQRQVPGVIIATMSAAFLAVLFFSAQVALSQVTTGIPPFASTSPSTFDTVNNANLNAHFGIPIFSRAGRGIPFSYVLSYDSSIWSPVSASGLSAWTPVGQTSTMSSGWGWRGITEAQAGYVSFSTSSAFCLVGGLRYYYPVYWNWTYHDAVGTPHVFNMATTIGSSQCGISPIPSATATATDGSGLTMTVTNYTTPGVYTPSGEAIRVPVNTNMGSSSVTDPNGNAITANLSGTTTTFTDTLGTTALTVSAPGAGSAATHTYPGLSGNVAYTVNYTAYTVQTNFGCPNITEYGATQQYLVSSIQLPDGTSYSFTYEATPGYPSNVSGRIKKVTLPTQRFRGER